MDDNDFNAIDWLALMLVIIGALNWGLIGLGMLMDAELNAVNMIVGFSPVLEAVIYLLVGLAGLYTIWTAYKAGQLT